MARARRVVYARFAAKAEDEGETSISETATNPLADSLITVARHAAAFLPPYDPPSTPFSGREGLQV